MSFNTATRVLSGTPATQTAASYTYKVEDSDGDEASDVFTIAVEDDSTPTLAATSDQTWVKSNAVSLTLPAGGNSPLTYSLAGDLPTGVSFNTGGCCRAPLPPPRRLPATPTRSRTATATRPATSASRSRSRTTPPDLTVAATSDQTRLGQEQRRFVDPAGRLQRQLPANLLAEPATCPRA